MPSDIDLQRFHNARWRWWRGIGFDRDANWLFVNGEIVVFGPIEGDIVEVIFDKQRTGTKEIARRVYGARDDVEDERGTITVTIRHIRIKLEPTQLRLVNLQGAGRGLEALYTFEWL